MPTSKPLAFPVRECTSVARPTMGVSTSSRLRLTDLKVLLNLKLMWLLVISSITLIKI